MTSVVIAGTNFTGATAVKFGGVDALAYVVNSPSQITASTPAHAADGTAVNVTVTTPGGTATLVGGYTYSLATAPTLASSNHAYGDTLGGGQQIVLTGTSMSAVTSVTILGASVAPVSTTSTTATFVLPAHAAGAGTISVTSPSGTSGTIAFEYFDPTSIFDLYLDGTQYSLAAGAGTWTARAGGNATEATSPPAVGSGARQLGGRNTVDFDGVNNKLTSLVSAVAWVTDAQGLILALFNADTAAADAAAGAPYMNPAIQSMQGSGTIIMGYSAAGLRAGCYASGYQEDPAVAASTSAWHLGKIYWDSSTLKQDVDSGTVASTPAGILTAGGAGYKFQFGTNYNVSAFFDGRIAVLAAAKVIPSAGSLLKFREVMNQQWGTSL